MNIIIENKNFGEERALYALKDASVRCCSFVGEQDGESALKETRNIDVRECEFHLRYPLWHSEGFSLDRCEFTSSARAPIWYARDGRIENVTLDSVKALRECEAVSFEKCTLSSEEFGWKCKDISLTECTLLGAYAFFDCKDINIRNIDFKGKYSFQYVENLTIEDSTLDTKDAFWHAKKITVKNSTVKGEYLGWFSEGLTLENCKIIGTQPFCYCKDLKLINCETEGTDLSFENSEVEAYINGGIDSIKNPKSGSISVECANEVIFDENALSPGATVSLRADNKIIVKQ